MWIKDILSSRKVVENAFLNYAGVQVARHLLSSATHAARGLSQRGTDLPEAALLERDGYVALSDFLPPGSFKQVKREFQSAATSGKFRLIEDGETRCERRTLQPANWRALPAVSGFLTDPRLTELLRFAERRPISVGEVWFDRIQHGETQAQVRDSQKQLHADVFFHSHKVWLFLEPVRLEDGPVCFVKGSHRTGLRRMAFEYKKSIRFKDLTDYSFRLDETDRRRFDIVEEPIVVPENTLLIANTRGFHRRGDALPGRSRTQIHFTVRSNPFFGGRA